MKELLGKRIKELRLQRKLTQEQLAEMVGGEQQKYFNTSQNARYIDSYAEGIAHEAKTGYTVASKRIIKQIEKDAELMNDTIDGAVWHFFRSKTTGKIGASRKVKQLLEKYHIGYIEHD